MLQIVSFGLSAVLAIVGVGLSVVGIVDEGFKTVAIGLVLIFAAGVFATLFLGTRVMARAKPQRSTESLPLE